MLQSSHVRLNFWPAVNAAGVLAIVALSGSMFVGWVIQTFDPSLIGDFGMTTDLHWRVAQIVHGAPAYLAGIKVGDHIEDVEPFNMRLSLGAFAEVFALAGERASFVDVSSPGQREVTLTARPLERLSAGGVVSQAMLEASCVVFVFVGAWLALVRPTMLTWGFYLTGAACVWAFGPAILVPHWLALPVLSLWQFIVSAGICGFLDFSLRFPSGALTGWRKIVERFIPYLFAGFVALGFGEILVQDYNFPGASFVAWTDNLQYVVIMLASAVGSMSLAGTYRASRDLERQRIAWVVLGLICVAISIVVFIFTALGVWNESPWNWVVESIIIVFPLAVAYAVVRHRVIDVRFVVSRAIVVGVLAAVVGTIVVVVDWLFSTRFTNSPLETAIYAAIGVAVGLTLNAARRRVGAAVDALFFRRWHRALDRADAIAQSVAHAAAREDLYEPLTSALADAFSLASCAFFERVTDGGFMRMAAFGWPRKTLWHVLPGDPILLRARGSRPISLDSPEWTETSVPLGVARPSLLVPIIAGKEVVALLLCGAHVDGTGLDPDEIKMIRDICADAGRVYGWTTAVVQMPATRS